MQVLRKELEIWGHFRCNSRRTSFLSILSVPEVYKLRLVTPTAVKIGPTVSVSLCTICFIMLSTHRFAGWSNKMAGEC
jgi:hypothetical protein